MADKFQPGDRVRVNASGGAHQRKEGVVRGISGPDPDPEAAIYAVDLDNSGRINLFAYKLDKIYAKASTPLAGEIYEFLRDFHSGIHSHKTGQRITVQGTSKGKASGRTYVDFTDSGGTPKSIFLTDWEDWLRQNIIKFHSNPNIQAPSQVSPVAQSKPGNTGNHPYPVIGSRWKAQIMGAQGEITIIQYDVLSDGKPSPEARVQFRWDTCSQAPYRLKLWSRTLDEFYKSKPQLISGPAQTSTNPSYPPIRSRWKKIKAKLAPDLVGHIAEVIRHPIPGDDAIQVKWESGRLAGRLDHWGPSYFYDEFTDVAPHDCFKGCAPKKPKQTNDGRDTCYACGAPTKPIGCFPGSKMRICVKCKK